jgi:hypothetical protein
MPLVTLQKEETIGGFGRILVVDDSADLRNLLTRRLKAVADEAIHKPIDPNSFTKTVNRLLAA